VADHPVEGSLQILTQFFASAKIMQVIDVIVAVFLLILQVVSVACRNG
jgi:hypothetical protein